jgi:hypothetical protein
MFLRARGGSSGPPAINCQARIHPPKFASKDADLRHYVSYS